MTVLNYTLTALIAYLIGSFSPGISFSRGLGRDIRDEGSKSSGATNAFRVMGVKIGLLTFLGDFLKATIALWIGRLLAGEQGALTAGFYVVIGHNWPVYYRFRGGKGIACSIAVMLWLFPIEALIALLAALLVVIFTKYVSLASLSFLFICAVAVSITHGLIPNGCIVFLLFALALFQHRSNLKRLMKGEENKLKLKRTA